MSKSAETISRNGNGEPSRFRTVVAILRGMVTASGTLGSLVILFMTLLVVMDVTLRSFFSLPIKGASEIGAFLVTAVVFLQTPLAVYEQRLTRLEWFENRIQGKGVAALAYATAIDAIGLMAFFLIAKASLPPLIESWETSEFFGTQGHFTAPSWPVRLTIVACSILAAVAFLVRIILRLIPNRNA